MFGLDFTNILKVNKLFQKTVWKQIESWVYQNIMGGNVEKNYS